VLWFGDSDIDGWVAASNDPNYWSDFSPTYGLNGWASVSETNDPAAAIAVGSHNIAIGMSTCGEWVSLLPKHLQTFQPSAVIGSCGMEDINFHGMNGSETFEQFVQVFELTKAAGVKLIVMGNKDQPCCQSFWGEYALLDQKMKELAQQEAPLLSWIDVNAGFLHSQSW